MGENNGKEMISNALLLGMTAELLTESEECKEALKRTIIALYREHWDCHAGASPSDGLVHMEFRKWLEDSRKQVRFGPPSFEKTRSAREANKKDLKISGFLRRLEHDLKGEKDDGEAKGR